MDSLANGRTACPHCGLAIAAMKHPKPLHYVYYHCTRSQDAHCREGSIEQKGMDASLLTYFGENFAISKDLHDWCLKNVETLEVKDVEDESTRRATVETTLAKKQKEYRELVMMKARSLISDDEFSELKGPLKTEIDTLERALRTHAHTDKAKIAEAKRAFSLALGIEEIFKSGTPQEKKRLLCELQSNLSIKDKKLNVCATGAVGKIIDAMKTARAENPSFEPKNIGLNQGQNEVFASVCPTMLRGLDSNQEPSR